MMYVLFRENEEKAVVAAAELFPFDAIFTYLGNFTTKSEIKNFCEISSSLSLVVSIAKGKLKHDWKLCVHFKRLVAWTI